MSNNSKHSKNWRRENATIRRFRINEADWSEILGKAEILGFSIGDRNKPLSNFVLNALLAYDGGEQDEEVMNKFHRQRLESLDELFRDEVETRMIIKEMYEMLSVIFSCLNDFRMRTVFMEDKLYVDAFRRELKKIHMQIGELNNNEIADKITQKMSEINGEIDG